MSYLKVFPRWEYLLLTLGVLLFCGGALAQTNQAVTVTYVWTGPTTRVDGSALTAADITGYELKLNSGSAQVAGNVNTYTKVYTLAPATCMTDIASARAKTTLWSDWSAPLTINLCPPSKVILNWSATVELK